MDLSLNLDGSVAIITGAAGQIGNVITDAFLAAGCYVGALDINITKTQKTHERLHWIQADTTNELSMITAWQEVKDEFGTPTICVAAAARDLSFIPHHQSVTGLSVGQFRKTVEANLTGTFITAKTWLTAIDDRRNDDLRNVSLIMIGSEAGVLGVPGNCDYAASKSAVQYGLTLSLAPDAARICPTARVNAIAPGAVDTPQFQKECREDGTGQVRWLDSETTVASKKPVDVEHVAKLCLMLASDSWSGSTTGQIVRVDGGKTGRLLWDRNGEATW